jgi:Domain of unknown function (DUF4432)
MLDAHEWTPEQIAQHSLDSRQFMDFRESTLQNGMRIIDAYNAGGLHFTLLPDRGLDIWTAHYKGIPLTWIAQGSPFPPDFGQTWLQQFNGGLLTTCGLTHVGPAEVGVVSGEIRDLHGRYSRLRTVELAKTWSHDEYGLPCVEISGIVREAALFGVQLRLTRTYRLYLHRPQIIVHDVITNLGDIAAPLMLLYHINVGFPLVTEGAELHTPHRAVYPRDDEARQAVDHRNIYDAPMVEFREEVYFHHLAEESKSTGVLLENGKIGVEVSWDASALPYFTQWKNTRQGIYVNGLEPGNCIPEGQTAARRTGRLEMLTPDQSREITCTLTIHEGSEKLQAAKDRIEKLRSDGTPTAANLSDFAQK